MIIGNGFLAHSFSHYIDSKNIVLFTSGVSNSQETNQIAFDRERNLLSQMLEDQSNKKLVYFGTCSIYDVDVIESTYVQHKIAMEKLVEKHPNYQIFRLPVIAGYSKNPHTLLNFLYKQISTESTFELWKNASRNIVDIDFVKIVCSSLIDQNLYLNSAINIAAPEQSSLVSIVKVFEKILDKKSHDVPINKGCEYTIPIPELSNILKKESLENYNMEEILMKYFMDKRKSKNLVKKC